MTPETDRPGQDRRLADLAYDLLNAVSAIRARAQLTRRRIFRVEELSRDHIGADLEQIEAQTQRLTGLIDPMHGGARLAPRPPRPGGATPPPAGPGGPAAPC